MFRNLKIQRCLKKLIHGDELERSESILELSRLGGEDVARQIADVVSQVTDLNVQCEAVGFLCRSMNADALGELLDENAIEALIELLGSHDGNVRYTAAATLAHLGEGRWVELVEGETFVDFEHLGASKDPRMIRPLLKALRDPDWVNRSAAAEALGTLGQIDAFDSLVAALDDEHWSVRAGAAKGLGELGDTRACEILWRAIQRGPMDYIPPDEVVISGPDDTDWDWHARCAAAIALGKLGDQRAVEPIKASMPGIKHEYGSDREAVHVLARLRGKQLPPDIEFTCPSCKLVRLRVAPNATKGRCPNCREDVPVPKDMKPNN